jgi:hypothetical protein
MLVADLPAWSSTQSKRSPKLSLHIVRADVITGKAHPPCLVVTIPHAQCPCETMLSFSPLHFPLP